MRTKVIAALLALLTALGGLNLFQSIKKKLLPETATAATEVQTREYRVDAQSDAKTREYRVAVREHAEAIAEVETDVDVAVDVKTRIVKAVRATASGDLMIEKSFDAHSGGVLNVDVEHADVNILTGDYNQVDVKVYLRGRDMERAREWFDAMDFQVRQEGNEVLVTAESPRRNWNDRTTGGAQIKIDIRMPKQFNIAMETTHGDVDLGSLEGNVHMKTTHGDVTLADIQGGELSITTSHGDIDGGNLASETIDLTTSHSEIEVASVVSRRFRARTTHSDVNIENVSGDTEIQTSHGDIQVNLTGNDNATFTTSHGDVMVYTARNLGADLDLRGARVDISSAYSVSGDVRKDQVDGRINGGGVQIRARTSHGSVSLRPGGTR